MLMSLTTSTVSTHQHDFPNQAMDDGHLFSHPLSYLHARLQALTLLGTTTAPKDPPPEVVAPSESSINGGGDGGDAREEASEISSPPLPISVDSRQSSSRLLPSTTLTTYQMAHPPPISKAQQRFSVRAKPLLQLRQMSAHRSPRPVADILPLATLAPNSAKLLPRIRVGRRGNGREDLVMVNCGPYTRASEIERSEGEESEEENGKSREVAAAIYNVERTDDPSARGAEICVGQGPLWTASVLPGNAGYEFVSMDEHGVQQRAKWIPTKKSRHQRTQTQMATGTAEVPERRYRFSVLTAGVRRHPVIGYINRSSISVCDQYVLPTTPPLPRVSSNILPTAATPQTPLDAYFDFRDRPPGGDLIDTDPQLRTLVLATGVWVALMESWFDAFKFSDAAANISTTAPARLSPQLHALRTTSPIITSSPGMATHEALPSPRRRRLSFTALNSSATPSSPGPFARLGSLPQRARSFASRHRNSFASSERPSAKDLAVAAAPSPTSQRSSGQGFSATSLAERASSDAVAQLRSDDGSSSRDAGSWTETPTGSIRGEGGFAGETKPPGATEQSKRIRRMLRFINKKAGG